MTEPEQSEPEADTIERKVRHTVCGRCGIHRFTDEVFCRNCGYVLTDVDLPTTAGLPTAKIEKLDP